ncbi:BTAD domain-containing putative transcriptional regulator [Nocardiopsis sp. HUAS JQ3]|uniref:AfsR/SARP family transcriptional regulator n=1 Tax=Nocardiopsis sp. HUAS JQ3 TaxID=3061629 RepID=UPI0023A97F89|nr:BTAD domain-containing putative transcriptional regulator [Nocardiopsis sp. HUAS JQ3]WDZ93443.1 BTAD domain-containing putative transcriptional regulator [Nocardiopsis sp. HUAS JQ3]
MRLCVLGSIHLSSEGRQVAPTTGKERALLAALALTSPARLPLRELADRLWNGSPPEGYRSTLHTYVTRLRGKLESAGLDRTVLTHTAEGYLLRLPAQALDWERFRGLRSRARALHQAGRSAEARTALEEALALWKGPPLAGVGGRWVEQLRVAMERSHQDALAVWASLAMAEGDHAEAVEVLGSALVSYPVNESLHGHLLHGLHALGRTADALAAYQRLRERLSDELGVDPSPALRRRFELLLRATAGPAGGSGSDGNGGSDGDCGPQAPPPATGRTRTIVDNLARDPRHFRGRTAQTRLLCSRLRETEYGFAHLWVVCGMAGVGKSQLSLHVAHRVKDLYPDARLSVDLRGHDERAAPLSAEEALTELMRLLRVPVPPTVLSLAERVALWREHTRSMRLLLLLEDAASAEQVLPLLPSGTRCAVVVTSRFFLPEVEGADHLPLGLPSDDECAEMFTAALDRPWGEEEADTLAEIIERCDRLPIAVGLVANLAQFHPSWSPHDLLHRLPSPSHPGLNAFRVGGRDLSRIFDVSVDAMDPRARDAFLLLGLHPTRGMDGRVAAALVGPDEHASRQALVDLVSAHLLNEPEPDRFEMHALLQVHARHRARDGLSPERAQAARRRMHAAYLSLTGRADHALHPHRPGRDDHEPSPTGEPWPEDRAMAWFRRELATVLTVVAEADRHGADRTALRLARVLCDHMDAHGPWSEAVALHTAMVEWAGERGEDRERARAHFDLARALLRVGALERAGEHSRSAHERWSEAGDPLGRAWAVAQRAMISYVANDYAESRVLVERALETFEARGHRPGIVFCLRVRGLCHFAVSASHEAITDFSDAATLLEHSQDQQLLMETQLNLAGALQQLGYHHQSWTLCEKVLVIARRRGDKRRAAVALTNMGEVSLHRGQPKRAASCLREALEILEPFGDPRAKSTILTNLGAAHAEADQPDQARLCFHRSLAAHGFVTPTVKTEALLGLARIEEKAGRHTDAGTYLRQASSTAQQHGLRREHAEALLALGQHLGAQSKASEACTYLRQAAEIFEVLQAPEAQIARSLLDTLTAR